MRRESWLPKCPELAPETGNWRSWMVGVGVGQATLPLQTDANQPVIAEVLNQLVSLGGPNRCTLSRERREASWVQAAGRKGMSPGG